MNLFNSISTKLKNHKLKYDDYFEEAKFVLAVRLSIFLSLSIFLLSFTILVNFDFLIYIFTLLAFSFVFITFLYILIVGKYKKPTAIFILFGVFICNFSLYFLPEQIHVIDGLWMVLTIFLSFYLLDKRISIFISIFNIASYFNYFIFHTSEQNKLLKMVTFEQSISIALHALICMIIIVYLVYQNSKTTDFARMKIRESENQLKHQIYTINKQNEEKTILIKEIHHRVKNNLQVIISLLRLQSNELKNEEAIEKLKDTTNRVIAMARIHERMYKNDQLSKINLEEYFSSFAKELKESLEVQVDVDLIVHCDLKDINLKAVVPLAIIMNELLTNSFKHAFVNCNQSIGQSSNECVKPFISIDFKELEEGNFTLTYQDSGCWKENPNNKSFGQELIHLMTEQLGGMFEINQKHSTYTFHFENTDW